MSEERPTLGLMDCAESPESLLLSFATPRKADKRYHKSSSEVFPPQALLQQHPLNLISAPSKTTCACTASKCLQAYCSCLQRGQYCVNCACKDCKNVPENQAEVFACREKAKKRKGCTCQKTQCTKEYCACLKERRACGSDCECTDCQNDGSSFFHDKNRSFNFDEESPPSKRPKYAETFDDEDLSHKRLLSRPSWFKALHDDTQNESIQISENQSFAPSTSSILSTAFNQHNLEEIACDMISQASAATRHYLEQQPENVGVSLAESSQIRVLQERAILKILIDRLDTVSKSIDSSLGNHEESIHPTSLASVLESGNTSESDES